MVTQKAGSELYLVVRGDDEYYVERRAVWGVKKTKTVFGKKAWLVLVHPDDVYDANPEDAMVFQHGSDLDKFAGVFEDSALADNVCNYLNGS